MTLPRSLRRGLPVLLLAALFGGPAATPAQTTRVLVSNIGQPIPTIGGSSAIATSGVSLDHAQQFTTGSSGRGYLLNNVQIQFGRFDTGFNFSVSIRRNASGVPGAVLGTLSNPTFTSFTTNRVLTFTASGSGIALAANTSYWVVLDVTGNVDSRVATWRVTRDTDEDAGKAAGWSLANMHRIRQNTDGATWIVFSSNSILKLRINGSIVPLPTVTIAAGNASVTEGTAAQFTVSRTGATTAALSVQLGVSENGTGGRDFVASTDEGSKTFSIPSGSASATYSVATVGDTTDEPNGAVTVTVNTDDAYTVGTAASATVTVSDNDATTSAVTGNTAAVVEGGDKTFAVSVGRALRAGESLAIPLSFTGSAVKGTDYSLACATATGVACNFAANERVTFTGSDGGSATSVTVTLSATSDNVAEPAAETVNVNPGTPVPGGLSGNAAATADSFAEFRIHDATPPSLDLSAASLRLSENTSANYTVALDAAPIQNVTVAITRGGTESGAATISPASLTFTTTNWSTARTVTVTGADEEARHRDRSLTLNHAVSSTDTRYGGTFPSATVAVEVLDAPELDAFEPFGYTPKAGNGNRRRQAEEPMSEFWHLRRDVLVAEALDYAIALSNPPVGGNVTVIASVADFTEAGLALTRNGTPQSSLTLTFTSDPTPGGACDTPRGSEGASGSWQCWRKVWILRKLPNSQSGCTDITHTASGGGVRTATTAEIGTVRAQIPSLPMQRGGSLPCRYIDLSAYPSLSPELRARQGSLPQNAEGSKPGTGGEQPSALFSDAVVVQPVFEGEKATIVIDLGRTLKKGERVELALAFSGATPGEDFALGLSSGGNRGVSFEADAPPVLVFTEGARTAELQLTAFEDEVFEQEVLEVSFGTMRRSVEGAEDEVTNPEGSLLFALIDATGPPLTITGLADASVEENVAWSADPLLEGVTGTVSWTLAGADAARFEFDETTGAVTLPAQDHEAPADADGDNTYEAELTATDPGGTDSVAFRVTVTDVEEAGAQVFTPDAKLVVDIRRWRGETRYGQEHVDRWTRVLIALGVETGSLAPMTVSEAEAHLPRGRKRWERVVAELQRKEAHEFGAANPPPAIDPAVVADARRYAAETGRGGKHVRRWKRVLFALTGGAEGIEPGMVSSEARTYVARGWARWEPVVEALRALEAGAPPLPGIPEEEAAPLPVVSLGPDLEANEQDAFEFAVTLSEVATGEVRVEWETEEGTASRSDFSPHSGSVRFAPGEREATIRILPQDDSHDEGRETFRLLLVRATGATIGDGEALGTIVNSDPLPAAWLSRFGRAVAEPVLDGITARLEAPRVSGGEGSFGAGWGGMSDPEPAALPIHENGGFGSRYAGPMGDGTGVEAGHSKFAALRGAGARPGAMLGEMLLGSRFAWTGDADGYGGSLGFWGHGGRTAFGGEQDRVGIEGDLTMALVGADYARNDWLMGVAVSRIRSDGGYESLGAGGAIGASLTTVTPYASWRVSPRLKLWSALGSGFGGMELRPEAGERMRTGLGWAMAAAGLRSELTAFGGASLALVSDALWANARSDRTAGMVATAGSVTRFRLGLESRWAFDLPTGGSVTPKLEFGARHDGGAAETGYGFEMGGGIAWSEPAVGLTLTLEGRTLVSHQDEAMRDRGVSASVSWNERPQSPLGLSLQARQALGGPSSGGLGAILGNDPLSGPVGRAEGAGFSELVAGYGIALGGRFTGTQRVGLATSPHGRELTGGWQLGLLPTGEGAPDFRLELLAGRSEMSGAARPGHRLGIEIGASW